MKWVAARRCREHKFERIADLSRKIEQLRKQNEMKQLNIDKLKIDILKSEMNKNI